MQITVDKIQERSRSRWLARLEEKPKATVRLFCFPFAGGTTHTYRPWQTLLPQSIDVIPVQPPGRGERLSEPPFHRLSEIVEALACELTPYLDKPFAFFGHSMGALIGLELARWLRKNSNRMPLHLFVSGRRAPQIPEPKPIARTWDLPEPEFIERVRQLNGTPREVMDHPELMQLMIPLLRADFAVCETYQHQPEPPLKCPLTVLGGVQDAEIPHEDLTPWCMHTSATCKLHLLRGDHFFVQTASVEIARIIAEELN
ncbi:MAG TPA: alpha/beta fold hydrolase [Pyrinomonadaceae bacterium]